MITVYSTLRNGGGEEIEFGQSNAHTVSAANAAADAWARGRLARCDDPDAYVEHVWSQSKPLAAPKPKMTTAEFLGAVEPTLDW